MIATGESHTVQEFIEIAFQELGLDWRLFVEERDDIISRQLPTLIGNSEKLRIRTGWKPTVDFKEMVQCLVAQAMVQQTQENLL